MTVRAGPALLYLTTAGGLALSVRALRGHPPSLPVAGLLLASYLALITLGMAIPRLQMWGDVLCSAPRARGLALTLEIHDPEDLRACLRVLLHLGVKATLFVPRALASSEGPALREARLQGHDVGLLAPADRWLFARPVPAVFDELARGVEALEHALGERPSLLRIPGWISPRLVRAASELELHLVGWSALAHQEPRDGAVLRVDRASPGCPDLPDILGGISARNLTLVPVSAFL